MAMKKVSGKSGVSGGGSMLKGMSRKTPSSVDKSMRPMGGRVDADATRKMTAATPRTLGPRNA